MARSYEVAVIGCGGVGAAALDHLARRGVRVLGLDRFPPGHARGSSHGETRVIRQAYFEHPDYVPLLLEAYRNWADLESRTGETLFRQVGLLQIGPPDGDVIRGVKTCASEHGLPIESLDVEECRRRYPYLGIPDETVGVFEERAGYLSVEACVRAHAREAQRWGAELHVGQTVRGWQVRDDAFRIQCDAGDWIAERIVVAAGAWANELLGNLDLRLRVLRKHLHWLPAEDACMHERAGCPIFLFELPHGVFYGFPARDAHGVKVGEHSGGSPVADPLRANRASETEDLDRVGDFVSRCLPRVQWPPHRHEICFYTMTPDEHFVVDHLPGELPGAFAAGLSGHGFKFTGVLGQALADLVLDGQTSLPIGFLARR